MSGVSNSRELQTEAISSKHPREAALSSENASRDLRIEETQNTLNIPREAALSSVNTPNDLSQEGSSLVTNAAAIFRLDATGVPSVSFACSTRTADTPKLEFVHSIPEVSPGSLGQRGFSGQLRGPVAI